MNPETVKVLLHAGADVNARDKYDLAVLMYAVINRNSEIVKALLSFGADIETRNEYGSVLMSAARKSNVEVVRALLQAGAEMVLSLKIKQNSFKL